MTTSATKLPALFLAASLASGLLAAAEQPLEVFLLAGQSNMAGNGCQVARLPDESRQPQKDVLVYQQGAWLPLEPGKAPGGPVSGPEITFGPAMARHLGRTIGIIKVAVGGTDLADEWSPENRRSQYAKLRRDFQAAQKDRPIVVIGMLWMQGESDAHMQGMAEAYQANLLHLIESARKDFGDPVLPFACGRVNPPVKEFYAFQDLVRNAQEKGCPSAYRMIDCDDLAKAPDKLHYNEKGQPELGKRFAAAMIDLLAAQPIRSTRAAPAEQ